MEYTKVESTGLDNRVYKTGAVRDSEVGKGRQDLIPYEPLRRLAVHYENGAKKYGDRNWEKGQDMAGHLRSAFRHLGQFMNGENDEDHLSACVWNIFSFIATEKWVIEGVLNNDEDIINSLHPIIKKRIEEARYQYNLKTKLKEMGTELKANLDKSYIDAIKKANQKQAGMENFRGILGGDKLTQPKFKMFYPIRVGDHVLVKDNPKQYFTGRVNCSPSMEKMAGRIFKVEATTITLKETMLKLRDDNGISWWFYPKSVEKVIE